MRVFFYINALYGGGAERVMSNLATQFANLGHEVGLVTTFQVENEYIVDQKVERYVLENEVVRGDPFSRNMQRVLRLRDIVKEKEPDVLVSFLREPNLRAIIATAGLKTRVVVSVRNDPVREYPTRFSQVVAKLLFRYADGIVFQTRDAQQWFPQAVQRHSAIIANQVAPRFYNRKLDTVRKNVITVGRLSEQKNHMLLLHAFSQIKDQVSDDLVIYGEGELRERLEQEIKTLGLEFRVSLPGSISNIEEKLAGAKVFVLSSDFEGMPNALMEAMAMGLPCISTDCPCGGPKMLIDNENSGILIPVGNITKLADALKSVLLDEKYAEQLGYAAKLRANEFRPEHIFSQWEHYIEIVSKK